jgi:hypothetical protein
MIMNIQQVSTSSSNPTGDALSQIGARGLVVYCQDGNKKDTYSYYADNNDQSWRKLGVTRAALESTLGDRWKDIETLLRARAPLGVVESRAGGSTFLVNLDACHAEASPVADRHGQEGQLPLDADLFLLVENGEFYAIPRSELRELQPINAGEAKVLVRRGAVVAAIPHNEAPYGTNCVLVNLTQLLPG